MFNRKKAKEEKSNKKIYTVETDNLAFPEVHTGKVKTSEFEDDAKTIVYDDLAIPEIHIKKQK